MNKFSHIPVLLTEAVDGLNVIEKGRYIDATLGGGGHTKEILKRGGIVLGIDQDEDALSHVAESLSKEIKSKKLTLVKGNFRDINTIAKKSGFENVDGILFDLGVSSYQLDNAGRGFSIKKDEKLDMRMDKAQTLNAVEVVNEYPVDTLYEIFLKYGEEHNARKIAQEIAFVRKKKEIVTTKELSSLIEKIGHKSEAIHPATRVFQAIRIEVNGEIEAIRKGYEGAVDLLADQGRMVVVSFHSLEDRATKQAFEKFKKLTMGTVITKKPLTASFAESVKNSRARSAKLRIFERIN